MKALSVIVCTHNPRPDYLRRTLAALQSQTLPLNQWELLLIDNASDKQLINDYDLGWHPFGKHIFEKELGLTPARLRGIREAVGDLVIFVDDDNVLAANYLAAASELFASRPDLGVASGRLLPEYETQPPAWFPPYESWLAIRRLEASRWSNFFDPQSEPCGAGMCLRRNVALAYADKAAKNSRQRLLGRRGSNLLSGEDIVITKVALEMGFSMGQFTELQATHLIPSRRVSEDYLFTLYRNLQASGQLISWLENGQPWSSPNWRVYAKAAIRWIKGGKIQRRLVREEFHALQFARSIAQETAAHPPESGPGALPKPKHA